MTNESDLLARIQARRAGAQGAGASIDPAQIAARRAALQPQEPGIASTPESKGTRIERGVMDFLQLFGQGVTAEGGDELSYIAAMVPGGQSPREAMDASRRATSRARSRRGLAGAVTEGAGALATGLLAPAAVAARGAGVLAPAIAGGVSGAVEGGLFGALGAEGGVGERLEAAKTPAAVGGGLGFVLGGAGGLMASRAAGRGARVGRELTERTGLPGDLERVTRSAENVRDIGRRPYTEIDRLGPIDNPAIAQVLKESNVPTPNRPRTLLELQKIRDGLRNRDVPASEELTRTMREQIAGLADADQAYGPFVRPLEAVEAGRQPYKTALDLRKAMEPFKNDPAATRNFASARLHDIVAQLEKRDESAVAMLRQFLDAGPETKAQLRTLFRGDDAALEGFMRVLGRERRADVVWSAFRRYAPWVAGAGVAGAGGAAYGLF